MNEGRDHALKTASPEVVAAIDTLMDKLDRQVLKHKQMLKDHNHQAIKRLPDQGSEEAAAA